MYYHRKLAVFAACEASGDERKLLGREQFKLSAEHAVAIFTAFGEACFVTGAKRPLTFMRIKPDKELSFNNAVPVKQAVKRLCGGVLHPDLRERACAVASSIVCSEDKPAQPPPHAGTLVE
jgi:hypothetical protein